MSRSQKNVSMEESYQEELENLAVKLYGSRKKQGQVVEHLIDLYEDESLVGMVENIHSVVVEGRSTHTQGSSVGSETDSSDTGDDDELLVELERKAEEDEPIDPDEVDLEVIKGKPVDRAAIVARAVLTGTHTGLDKNSIQEFCQREVGYSINAARDLAKEAMWELEDELYNPIPSNDWLKEQVEADIRNDLHDNRKGGEGVSPAKYRREYGKSVEAYAEARSDLPNDGPYASEQEAADAVYETFNVLLTAIDGSRSKYQTRRARAVMREVWERTDVEVRSTQPSDADMTLEFIVASNDDLKDVLVSGESDES